MSRSALTWLIVLAVIGGCFTIDGTLKADGSGTLEIKLDPIVPTSERNERKLFTGPDTTLDEIEIGELRTGLGGHKVPKWVRARLSFKDVTKLNRVKRLQGYKIALADAGEGKKRFSITVSRQKSAGGFTHEEPVTIRLTFPGEIVESSGRVEGKTVVWTYPAGEFFAKAKLELTATYQVAAAKPAEKAGEKSGEKHEAVEKNTDASGTPAPSGSRPATPPAE